MTALLRDRQQRSRDRMKRHLYCIFTKTRFGGEYFTYYRCSNRDDNAVIAMAKDYWPVTFVRVEYRSETYD